MISNPVTRDERTVAVENAGYRWAYLVLSFGLLASTAYRGFVRNDSAWDLLALVLLGGAVATLYQGGNRVLTRRWTLASLAATVLAALLGAALLATAR